MLANSRGWYRMVTLWLSSSLLCPCSAGCSSGGRSWRKVASVPGSDSVNIQVYPHASGWGAMSTCSVSHSDLPKEPGQYGAEEQEENIHAFTQWVSWTCSCPNTRRLLLGREFKQGVCMDWTIRVFGERGPETPKCSSPPHCKYLPDFVCALTNRVPFVVLLERCYVFQLSKGVTIRGGLSGLNCVTLTNTHRSCADTPLTLFKVPYNLLSEINESSWSHVETIQQISTVHCRVHMCSGYIAVFVLGACCSQVQMGPAGGFTE